MTKRLAAVALLVPLVGCAFTVRERDFVVQHAAPRKPTRQPVQQENVTITDGGALLSGWLLSVPNAKRAIVFFNGNGGTVLDVGGVLTWLAGTLDANVLAVDYRGYGFSDGRAGFSTLGSDAQRVMAYAQTKFAGLPLFLMGHSLGTAVAIAAAVHGPAVAGVVLFAPFTSIEELARALRDHGPWYARLVRGSRRSTRRCVRSRSPSTRCAICGRLCWSFTVRTTTSFPSPWAFACWGSRRRNPKSCARWAGADHESVLFSGQSLDCLIRYFANH